MERTSRGKGERERGLGEKKGERESGKGISSEGGRGFLKEEKESNERGQM